MTPNLIVQITTLCYCSEVYSSADRRQAQLISGGLACTPAVIWNLSLSVSGSTESSPHITISLLFLSLWFQFI